MSSELDIIKKIHYGNLSEEDLMGIFYDFRSSYRVMVQLIQHPRFPEQYALNIIPTLYTVDLFRVIKNKRTKPYIRKRAELEFMNKYPRLPRGEKIGFLKIAPLSLLRNFLEEDDEMVLQAVLNNPSCTEDLVIAMVNRERPRNKFYEVLRTTEWFKRPLLAEAISLDREAPIRMMIEIIPFLRWKHLKVLYEKEDTHKVIKDHILLHLKNRK